MKARACTAVLLAALLAATGCGSSSSSGSSTTNTTTTPPATTSGGGVTVSTASVKGLGTVLVDSKGDTLYLFLPDKHAKVTCTGACATVWPPLKLPAGERLQFLAGQYIDILLKEGKRRSFSLANPPHDDQFLQLHVRKSPNGAFSGYVFEQMKERAILRFEGPLGTFYLREDSDKPMLFVAGGTGFAPVKAQIEHCFHAGIDRQMVLYWGVRSLKDLYMRDLPGLWQAEHANFTFIPVISDPLPEDQWTGRTGLVHQAVLDDFADLSGWQVYACGAAGMTDIARKTFVEERGLPEDEFYCDAFTPSVDPRK